MVLGGVWVWIWAIAETLLHGWNVELGMRDARYECELEA